MKNWFRKTFRKSKIICVYLFDETGRFNEYVVYPDKTNNMINIDEQSYIFSVKNIIYVNGYPSLFYKKNNPKPIDFKKEGKAPEITASELNTIVNNSVVKDLIKAGKEDKKQDLVFYGIVSCVIGIVLLAYFANDLINTLETQKTMIENMNAEIIQLKQMILRP